MVSEVFAGLGAFKTMFDMAKALKDINDAVIRNGAVIELQEQILSAQEQQSALIERVRALEAEVAGFKAWDAEKQNYELKALTSGGIVYVLKPEARGTKPPHWLCPNCYEQGKKAILQPTVISHFRYRIYLCPACKGQVPADSHQPTWLG